MKNYGAVTDPKDITTKEYVDGKLLEKVDKTALSTVATTGQYSDLLGKPVIPPAGNSTIVSPNQPTLQNIGDTWYKVV